MKDFVDFLHEILFPYRIQSLLKKYYLTGLVFILLVYFAIRP